MNQNVIIRYLYEAQHVSGDTPPIIRSLKLLRDVWLVDVVRRSMCLTKSTNYTSISLPHMKSQRLPV
jgi:IS1 family transposase